MLALLGFPQEATVRPVKEHIQELKFSPELLIFLSMAACLAVLWALGRSNMVFMLLRARAIDILSGGI